MSFYYYFNKIIYNLSSDKKIPLIEEVLHCSVIGGNYYPRFTSYLIKSSCDESKLQQLESVLKCHIEIIKKDYNYILKCYYRYQLPAFIEYEPHPTKELVLGIGYDGLVKMPMNTETNNYLICGCSGSGKSTLAIAIIKNLIDNGVSCVICDNKSSFDYDSLDVPLHKGIESCLAQLDLFELEIDKRMKVNKRHAQKLLVIDEIFPFLLLESKERKHVMNQLALIMSKCRSVNCHIMIITQRATTDIIDSKILTNISNRICLATSSKQESINVLNCEIAYDITIKGRGYLSVNGRLKEFQSYYYKPPKQDKNIPIENDTIAHDVEYNENKEIVYFD